MFRWFIGCLLGTAVSLGATAVGQSDEVSEAPLSVAPSVDLAATDPLPPTPFELLVDPERWWAKQWDGSAEFGLNGAQGNSQNLNLRFLADVERESDNYLLKANLLYNYATAAAATTENRLLFKARHELPLDASNWKFFLSRETLYNEFTAYDVRLAGHFGMGYQWLDDDRTNFKTRAGIGGSRELGGPQNRFMPECLFGYDFDHKINDRHKLTSTFDYYPEVRDFGDFRWELRAGYEILLDPDWNLSLKLGVLNLYDSTPEGAKPSDLQYFATLKWTFGSDNPRE